MAKTKPICTECKSDSVLLDCFAQWDESKQQWEVVCETDDYFCPVCEGPTHAEWRPL